MFPDLARDDVFRLETRRLWLRWPRPQDVVFIAQAAADERVAAGTCEIPQPYPEGAAAEFVLTARNGNSEGKQLVLVLAPREAPGLAIGSIALTPICAQTARLRFWLGHSFWGRGLMTEAAQNLLDLAFRLTGLEQIRAQAQTANPAALRVLAKCGFVASDEQSGGGALEPVRFAFDRPSWSSLYVRSGADAQDPMNVARA